MKRPLSLSAADLKYLAALCMLLDHMGVVFPHLFSGLGLPAALDLLPRCVGRLAFPIFAYFVAEGCRRTRFFHRYLIRLGVFALVSQVPFTLTTGTWGGNVILTFFLAALAIYGYERLVKAEYSLTVAALPLLGACVLRVAWIRIIFQIPQFHTPEVIYWSYPFSWAVTFLAHVVCYLWAMRRLKRHLAEDRVPYTS